MKHTIQYEASPKHEDTQVLWEGISRNARKIKGFKPGEAFAFFLNDANAHIKGGCSGYIFYGCLYVDLLWVDEELRGNDYGTSLMIQAEELARQKQCHFVAVNSMDFEAVDFYKKLGFYVEFVRHGFDKGAEFYFLRKNLNYNS